MSDKSTIHDMIGEPHDSAPQKPEQPVDTRATHHVTVIVSRDVLERLRLGEYIDVNGIEDDATVDIETSSKRVLKQHAYENAIWSKCADGRLPGKCGNDFEKMCVAQIFSLGAIENADGDNVVSGKVTEHDDGTATIEFTYKR